VLVFLAIATLVATLVGGLFALRFRDKLHLVLGFSAGAVIGVAFFDLLPESLELGEGFFDASVISAFVALGFLCYLILDRLTGIHADVDDGHGSGDPHRHGDHAARGKLGAASLVLHSFLDGAAIGLAFQVSSAVGIVVAIAVLVHDFSDGINTVGFVLRGDPNSNRSAFRWLVADAVAPVLGVTSTLFFTLPEKGLAVVLSLFTGFFLYIGASDLIPESHHAHPKFLTTAMTVLGVVVMFVAIRLAGV